MSSSTPVRLAVFAASPIYYQAPLYRRLAADPRLDFTAVFSSTSGIRPDDFGYTEPVAWDVDPLEGYRNVFLRRAEVTGTNTSSFFAYRDPDIAGLLWRGDYEALWMHGYNSFSHLLAYTVQTARRRPVLFREEQTLLHRRALWKSAVKRVVLRALFARAYALYIGTQNRRWFDHYGIAEQRQFFAPYCVDNDRFRADAARLAPAREELRRELGVPEDSGPVILTVARLIPKKQPLFLLEAFRRVRAGRRCTLVFVGSGELEGELRSAIERERIPDVVLAGFRNQSRIARVYAAADVFALPSKLHETWGLAVNEAMNFGLPVVVSDKVGCAADLVEEGVGGYVVPAGDPGPLADRLAALVDSPELRERMGAASLERISSWSYDLTAAGILAAVAAAVGPERWAAAAPEPEPALRGAV